MKVVLNRVFALVAALVVAASAAAAAPAVQASERVAFEQLAKKVRKELVTLPWYGVFDNLEYAIDGSTVTLSGQVVQPSTRKDAERRVSRLKGVERVVNNIEVLPLSRFDDSIRANAYEVTEADRTIPTTDITARNIEFQKNVQNDTPPMPRSAVA